jgi:hypothetical protein
MASVMLHSEGQLKLTARRAYATCMNKAYSTMTSCQTVLASGLGSASVAFASAASVADFRCKCDYNLGMSSCLNALCPGAATVYDQVISVNCAAATNGGVVPSSIAQANPFGGANPVEGLAGAAELGGKRVFAGAAAAGIAVGALAMLL